MSPRFEGSLIPVSLNPHLTCIEGDVEAPAFEVANGEGHQAAGLGPIGGVGQLPMPLDLSISHVFCTLELLVAFPEGRN